MLRDCIRREPNLEQDVKEGFLEDVKLLEEENFKLKFKGRVGATQRESEVGVGPGMGSFQADLHARVSWEFRIS